MVISGRMSFDFHRVHCKDVAVQQNQVCIITLFDPPFAVFHELAVSAFDGVSVDSVCHVHTLARIKSRPQAVRFLSLRVTAM